MYPLRRAVVGSGGGAKLPASSPALKQQNSDGSPSVVLRQQDHVRPNAYVSLSRQPSVDSDADDDHDATASASAAAAPAAASASAAAPSTITITAGDTKWTGVSAAMHATPRATAADDDDSGDEAEFTPGKLAAQLSKADDPMRVHPLHHPTLTANQCETIFAQFDHNADGHIDSDELQAVCTATGVTPWRALKELDTDRDGRISKAEFVAWWQRDRTRIALENASGLSYERVAAFRRTSLARAPASRNLLAPAGAGDALAPPPASVVAAGGANVSRPMANAPDQLQPKRSSLSAPGGSVHGSGSGVARMSRGELSGASRALLHQVGAQLGAIDAAASSVALSQTQRAAVTAKFRAVQSAVADLEQLLTKVLSAQPH